MAVLFDAKATVEVHAEDVDTANLDLTGLTIGAGSNRVLVATIAIHDINPPPVFTVTWDPTGTPQGLTLITSINNGNNYTYLYGLVNPASGNKTLRMSTTGAHTEVFLDAASFTGADQTGGATTFANAATNTGTSTAPSVVIASAVGNMTIDSVNAPQVINTPTMTEIYSKNDGVLTSAAASYGDGSASNTHQWALGASVAWASCGCDGGDCGLLGSGHRQRATAVAKLAGSGGDGQHDAA